MHQLSQLAARAEKPRLHRFHTAVGDRRQLLVAQAVILQERDQFTLSLREHHEGSAESFDPAVVCRLPGGLRRGFCSARELIVIAVPGDEDASQTALA